MAEPSDHQLLNQFACAGDQDAFTALVSRHVNLVYSAARRFAGDNSLAEEITQAVFIILARKAKSISSRIVLTGWLYQTARLTAANALKQKVRRQKREQEVYLESTINAPDCDASWEQLAPVLDDAMNALRSADRDAVLLRYFANKPLSEVGATLGVSEDAARVRVKRALEKLRNYLGKRGVVSTTTAIATVISGNSVQAAPVGLVGWVTTTAGGGAAVGTSTTFLAKGTMKMMLLSKFKTAIGVAALFVAGVAAVAIFHAYKANDAATGIVGSNRVPTVEELQELFNLATKDKPKVHLVADISIVEMPWTDEQIDEALQTINKVMEPYDRRLAPSERVKVDKTQREAIARAHGGKKLIHVEEWYSGAKSRMDRTDESAATATFLSKHSGAYHDTYVNIHDPAFSPYSSFVMNHEIKDAQVSRDPTRWYETGDLWRAYTLEDKLVAPLVMALADISSVDVSPHSQTRYKRAKIDTRKVEEIRNGKNQQWHIEAIDESSPNGATSTRFEVRGSIFGLVGQHGPVKKCAVVASYRIKKQNGRPLCFDAAFTNLVSGDSFVTKRDDPDDSGFPRRWSSTTCEKGKVVKNMTVKFHLVDLNGFNDADVFSANFPTNYIVSDITRTGPSVIIQNPGPQGPIRRKSQRQ